MFNKGEGGFKDRDLYVSCANASDGVVTAHPYLKGEQLQDIKGKKGYPLGQEIMKKATEGHDLAIRAMQPLYSTATLVKVNDVRGHAAVLALFDEVIAAG